MLNTEKKEEMGKNPKIKIVKKECLKMGNNKKKIITLNLNNSFKWAYTRGKHFTSSVVVTYIARNRHKNNRIGITASKKIGNAVKRNRARRIIKEAYRLMKNNLRGGYDLVFVARSKTAEVKMGKVKNDIKEHLKRAGLYYEDDFKNEN